jgi:subtilase family serine protease
MGRNFIRYVLVSLVLVLIVGGSLAIWRFSARANAPTSIGSYVALGGHTVPLITQKAQVLQSTSTNQPLALSISLQPRDSTGLDTLLQALYDPNSASYHQFLTPDQFQQLFSPTIDDVQQVVDYLQGQGLTVTNIAPNNLLIDASGTVGQAQQAFRVHMQNYRLGTHTFYANVAPPQVPSDIQPLINAITGLDNSVQLQPSYQRQIAQPRATTGYGPQELAAAYNIAPLHNLGIQGDGQTVALFELDGYNPSDVAQYLQHYTGSPLPNIHSILVDGFNGVPGGGSVEVEMDMEVMAAIAPHATQLVYQGLNTNQGVNDTYNRIVTDNKAQVVSISWGICEAVSGAGELRTLDTIFKQGAAQGMSFFAAAGDSGAYDCKNRNLGVDSPASDPYVTGVGGTTLQMPGAANQSETVWSDRNDTLRAPMGSAGGGGLSSTYKQLVWQAGPGVKSAYSNGYREVPDVAANADPSTGYSVYCTVHNAGCSAGGWLSLGGTSAATPVWAASTLLLNQYMHNQGKVRWGFANPMLYALASVKQPYSPFNDITSGDNLYYPATPNYDLASGLGTPDVYNIARDIGGVPYGGISTPVPTSTPMPISTNTPVSIAPPTISSPSSLAQDTFQRADQALWGTASDGNIWMGDANNASVFSISNSSGQIAGSATSVSAVLGSQVANSEVIFSGLLSAFNGSNIGAVVRWIDGNNWYKGYIDGSNLIIQRKVNGTTSTLASIPFVASSGTSYTIHLRVVGTTLSLNAWSAGQSEPMGWLVTADDSSLQSGYSGLRVLAPGSTVATISSFQVNAL